MTIKILKYLQIILFWYILYYIRYGDLVVSILLLFFIYSVLGFLIESVACSFWEKKIVKDRGFLIGPYCPIYGTGAIMMILFLTKYKNDPLAFFIMAVVYASIIEYLTSYILEKLFKARWWDYSDKKFNVNGRISLSTSFMFGVLGIFLIYFMNPLLEKGLSLIPKDIFICISLITLVFFLIDIIVTFTVVSRLKLNLQSLEKDSTSQIDKQIKEVLRNDLLWYKHIYKSFPKLEFNFDNKGLSHMIKNTLSVIEEKKKENREEIKKIKKKIHGLKKEKASKETIKEEKQKIRKMKDVK